MSTLRTVGCLLVAAACALGAGCAALPAGRQAEWPPEPPPEPQFITRIVPAAKVIRVNPRHRYVILECTVLPNEGEEAKVFRGDDEVAAVRMTRNRRGTLVAADILEGTPQPGDAVRLERRIPVAPGQEVRP